MIARARALFAAMNLGRERGIVGMNRRNVELIYPNNKRKHYRFGDDKLLTKRALSAAGVLVPETLATCKGLYAVHETIERLSQHEAFVVKPNSASGGEGILVLSKRSAPGVWTTPGGRRVDHAALRKHIADIVFGTFGGQMSDVAFAEHLVRPHHVFQRVWPDGLCDLRILTLHGRPFMAMLRIPTRASDGKANLHQGGIGAAVALDTGRITRALWRGVEVQTHPDSGATLLGLEVPSWKDVLGRASLAASAVPLGYLGVDLVIDDIGRSLVLEVNVRPGLEIQNVHGISIEEALGQVQA